MSPVRQTPQEETLLYARSSRISVCSNLQHTSSQVNQHGKEPRSEASYIVYSRGTIAMAPTLQYISYMQALTEELSQKQAYHQSILDRVPNRKSCSLCAQKNLYRMLLKQPPNAEADDDANLICSISTPPPNVPYHVGYTSRRVHCTYYSTYYARLLRVLVFVFERHKLAQSCSP